jgi:hypothetical protein
MTPKRKYALQWFHDRGEVGWFVCAENPPSDLMRKRMIKDGHLQKRSQGDWKPTLFSLTDAGRQALHEANP